MIVAIRRREGYSALGISAGVSEREADQLTLALILNLKIFLEHRGRQVHL